jgi:hypothetical protein
LYNGCGTYSTGNPRAGLLLGIPDLYSQQTGGNGIDRAQEYYSYFQDQWKVRPNLTLTYGLGWQIDTAMQDLAYGGHGMAAFYQGQQSTVFPNAPLGVVYSGDRGVHPTGTNHPFGNFGPRVGIAYSPDWGKLMGGPGKTGIRGGFGMYYNRTEEELNFAVPGRSAEFNCDERSGNRWRKPGLCQSLRRYCRQIELQRTESISVYWRSFERPVHGSEWAPSHLERVLQYDRSQKRRPHFLQLQSDY